MAGMKKWMKGFIITGTVLLGAGTGITALAGAMGGRNYLPGRYRWERIGAIARRINHHPGWEGGIWNDSDYWEDLEDELEDWDDENWRQYGGEYKDEWKNSWEEYKAVWDIWNDRRISKEGMTLAASYQNVGKLDLQVRNALVRIVENDELDGEIAIYWKKDPHSRIRHYLEDDGELSIEYYDSRNNNGYAEGIIEIPEGYTFSEADLEVNAGKLEISCLSASELKLDAKAAAIQLSSFKAKELDADVKAGYIEAAGSVSGNAEAEASTGQIKLVLEGKNTDYNYSSKGNMGTIKIGGEVHSGVFTKEERNNNAGKELELISNLSSIEIAFK